MRTIKLTGNDCLFTDLSHSFVWCFSYLSNGVYKFNFPRWFFASSSSSLHRTVSTFIYAFANRDWFGWMAEYIALLSLSTSKQYKNARQNGIECLMKIDNRWECARVRDGSPCLPRSPHRHTLRWNAVNNAKILYRAADSQRIIITTQA